MSQPSIPSKSTARCPVVKTGEGSLSGVGQAVVVEPSSSGVAESSRRYLLALIGVLFTGLAAVGAVLPGIPTVGPLLLASYCFSKSCPWLEQRLIRNRFFARFHHYLDHGAEMPLRARLVTIAIMWASIGISVFTLYASGQGPVGLWALIILAGLVGTWFIARFGRPRQDVFARK